jgi:hypothetical protein
VSVWQTPYYRDKEEVVGDNCAKENKIICNRHQLARDRKSRKGIYSNTNFKEYSKNYFLSVVAKTL